MTLTESLSLQVSQLGILGNLNSNLHSSSYIMQNHIAAMSIILGFGLGVFLVYANTASASRFVIGGVGPVLDVPIATSGNNLYMAWPNNDTGHWNVFFAKSTDGGKTMKTMIISAPNKGHTVDLNAQIATSGSSVYVTWWTNKTGTLMPVFRASNDNGDTFAKARTLNSTG
jgi:hypothetical protein